MNIKTQEKLQKSYEKWERTAKQFAKQLEEQVQKILSKNEVSIAVPLELRVKPWDSILSKIESKSLEFDSVIELDDFIGLRIILLFKRDVNKVCNLISSEFDVIESEDTIDRLGVSEFGYQSKHYLIKLKEKWLSLPTFSECRKFKVEIQIRTAAQHIWAAASHTLQYKHANSVPPDIRRSINRVAAILELVDLEFERTLQERETYTDVTDTKETQVELNVDNLRLILDEELPTENKSKEEPYAEILRILDNHKINTIGALRKFLQANKRKILDEDKKIIEIIKKDGIIQDDGRIHVMINGINTHTEPSRIERGVFRTHIGLIRGMLNI